ncbi:hypothetical protein L0156_10425 [bacterium]|nr:hypothetical protein [bacterium]
MRKTVYFDSNVFVDLHSLRNGITQDGRKLLEASVRSGKFDIVPSLLNFEESLHSGSETFDPTARFQFMLRITNWNRIFKGHNDLVYDEIKAFCSGEQIPSPYIEDSKLKDRVISFLHNPKLFTKDEEFKNLMQEARAEKIGFMNHSKEILKNFVAGKKKAISAGEKTEKEFEELYDHFLEYNSEGILTRYDLLNECNAKDGIPDLLKHSPRLKAVLAYSYSLVYGEMFEALQPVSGDRTDIQHAIYASCAENFVTHDENFNRLISRIPDLTVKVFGALKDFLQNI